MPPAMEEYSYFSTSSQICVVAWGFDLSHSDWCKVESQGPFILHFHDHQELWTAIQDSSVVNSWFNSVPYFWLGCLLFLVVSFLTSLYILNISPLSDLGLVKIFSQSIGWWFVLLAMSFQSKYLKFHKFKLVKACQITI